MRRRLLDIKGLDKFYLTVYENDPDSTGNQTVYIQNAFSIESMADYFDFYDSRYGGEGYFGYKNTYLELYLDSKTHSKKYVMIVEGYVVAKDTGYLSYASIDNKPIGVTFLYTTLDPNVSDLSGSSFEVNGSATLSTRYDDITYVLWIFPNSFWEANNVSYINTKFNNKSGQNVLPTVTNVRIYEGADNEVFYLKDDERRGTYFYPEIYKSPKKSFSLYTSWTNHVQTTAPSYDNLITYSFQADWANNDNYESKDIRILAAPEGKEKGTLKDFFSNNSAGSQYVVFGVWKYVEGKTKYSYSDALWKLVFGSPEQGFGFGFSKTTSIEKGITDFSYFGCKLINGSDAVFEPSDYGQDYGNINDIKNNLLQFSLTRETIDNEILSKIGTNDKLVVGMCTPNALNDFRHTSTSSTDGNGDCPAVGWRKNSGGPYWYSQVYSGDKTGSKCVYSVIDSSRIKSGTTQGGCNVSFQLT